MSDSGEVGTEGESIEISEASRLYEEARARMERGDLESAVEAFQESIRLGPHFKSLELLGECYMRLHRCREAVVPLAAATALNRQARAPSLLAEVFMTLGDFHAAEEMAEQALSRAPTNRKALRVRKSIADRSR